MAQPKRERLPTLDEYLKHNQARSDFAKIWQLYQPQRMNPLNEIVFSESEMQELNNYYLTSQEANLPEDQFLDLIDSWNFKDELGLIQENSEYASKGTEYFVIDPDRSFDGNQLVDSLQRYVSILACFDNPEESLAQEKMQVVLLEHILNVASLGIHTAYVSNNVEDGYHERNHCSTSIQEDPMQSAASQETCNLMMNILTEASASYANILRGNNNDYGALLTQIASLRDQDLDFMQEVVTKTNSLNREREGCREAQNYIHASDAVLDWFKSAYESGELNKKLVVAAPYYGGLTSATLAYTVINDYLIENGITDFELDIEIIAEKKGKRMPKNERPLHEIEQGRLKSIVDHTSVLLVDDTVGSGDSKEMYKRILKDVGASTVYLSSVEGVNTEYTSRNMDAGVSFQGLGTAAIKGRITSLYETSK